MANNFVGAGDGSNLPEAEARDALKQLQDDGSRLATRVVTPWWYHPVLGASMAALVGSQALPGAASIWMVAVGVAMPPILAITYARRYGVVSSRSTGPRAKRLLLTLLVIVALAFVGSLVVRFVAFSAWWGLAAAVAAFVATILLGRRYDDALRDELADKPGKAV